MTDRADLGLAMAEFARSLALSDSLEERLAAVTNSAVRMIDGVSCADILLIAKGRFESVAATEELPIELDALQQKLGEGPCLDAAKDDPIVRCDDLRIDSRWPLFALAAVESGVHSMLSLKLDTGKDTIGALNLFGFEPGAFDVHDENIGSMLATHAAIALLGARKDQQFRSALASRDIIGQAKGMVMERYGFDGARAFELLSTISQKSNVPMATVAARMVEAHPAGAAPTNLGRSIKTDRSTGTTLRGPAAVPGPTRHRALEPPPPTG